MCHNMERSSARLEPSDIWRCSGRLRGCVQPVCVVIHSFVSLVCRCTGAHHRHVRSFVAKLLEAKQFGEGPAEACTKHLIGDAEKAGLVRWKAVGDKERDCGEEAEVATVNFSFESASRGGYITCGNCCAGQVFRFPAISRLVTEFVSWS